MTIDGKPLRVGSYNLLDGGVDEAGDRRWRAQLDVLDALSLDVLAVQEATHWDRDDFARLHATADALRMQPLFAPSRSHGCHIVVFHRWPRVRSERWNPDAGCGSFHHTLARARLRVEGFAHPVVLLATHLDPFSGGDRLAEAGWMTEYAAPGRYTILAGDLNTIGAADPEPDWSRVADHLHSRHRLVLPDGSLGPTDRRAMRLLTAAGFIDPPERLGLVFARTAGYHRTGEPLGRRSDFVLVSAELAPALVGHRVVDTETTRAASDHLPVVVDLALDRLA
jgi:exodeoxyribonuclease-3